MTRAASLPPPLINNKRRLSPAGEPPLPISGLSSRFTFDSYERSTSSALCASFRLIEIGFLSGAPIGSILHNERSQHRQ